MDTPLKPTTTQVPDIILDNLPAFTDPELRIVLMITRHTFGWQKKSDWLSSSQLVRYTGKSRASVSPAANTLVNRGILVIRNEEGKLLDTPEKRKIAGEHHKQFYYELGNTKVIHEEVTPATQLTAKCAICEDIKKLVTHHVKYIPEERIQICYHCHAVVHAKNDQLNQYKPEMSRRFWESIKAVQVRLGISDAKLTDNPFLVTMINAAIKEGLR